MRAASLLVVLAESAAALGASWHAGVIQPPPSRDHVLVFDAGRGRVVLWGGGTGNSRSTQTCELQGTEWLPVAQAPPAMTWRTAAAAAYDSRRGRTVLFGGSNYGRDTWEYDGFQWRAAVTAPASLQPRSAHAMAYDPARGATVLVGGRAVSGQVLGDCWLYDGQSWSQAPAPPSGPRYAHGMAYDATRGRVVIFGGNSGSTGYNDTWEFDGGSWSAGPVAPAGLTPRYALALAYDAARARTVLFGGSDASGPRNDTWEYDGNGWTAGPAAPVALSPRLRHAMAYDAFRTRMVLFGGGAGARVDGDTWQYDGTAWTAIAPTTPPGRTDHALAYDSARGRTILFGDWDQSDTWELDRDGAWHQGPAAPPAMVSRRNHVMAFDESRARTVLFGGFTPSTVLADTWEYDGTAWMVGPTAGPPGRGYAAMAFDGARRVSVLQGGCLGWCGQVNSVLSDTWQFDGAAWTQAAQGPKRGAHAAAHDSRRNVTLVFGGYDGLAGQADVWEFDGSQWRQGPPPPPALVPRIGHGLAYDGARGVSVTFGALEPALRDTWEYDGSAWTQGPAAPELLFDRPASLAHDAASRKTILFSGADMLGYVPADTWRYGTERCYLLGAGHGPSCPNRVRLVDESGAPTTVDFSAYAAGAWGCGPAAARLYDKRKVDIVTGPGPGALLAPHVRAFRRDGTPIAAIGFFAYGTLRYGVNASSGDVDADGYDEILSAAGPGAVFGPHARGWNFDGSRIVAISLLNYFAYGTLQFGAEATTAALDVDGFAEILTAPGPGPSFAPTIRGWQYDAGAVAAMARINFNALPLLQYGAHVAAGDLEPDRFGEIAAAPGVGPLLRFEVRGYDFDGNAIAPLPGFSLSPFPTLYGGRIALADVQSGPEAEIIAAPGPDPTAASQVDSYAYYGGSLWRLSVSFTAFPGYAFGANVTGGDLEP